MKKIFYFVLLSFFASSPFAFSLVDYGGTNQLNPEENNTFRPASPKKMTNSYSSAGSTSKARGFKYLQFNTFYDSLSVDYQDIQAKVSTLHANLIFSTPYNLFAEVRYFQGQTSNRDISGKSSLQGGNPYAKIGFNWLQIGTREDNARVDLFGAFSAGMKQSALASTRTDKIAGVESSRRFYDFVLALGGEVVITGDPEDKSELAIGNIFKMGAAIGWVVSEDIRLSLETNYYKINERSDKTAYRLSEGLSFSTISPLLTLGFSSIFELKMGAHLRVKRAQTANKNENLLDAKLFNIPAVYGNSIFAGLNISV